MEKHRFYVELPGDFWESGTFMRMLKTHLPHRTADGRIPYSWLLQEGQVTLLRPQPRSHAPPSSCQCPLPSSIPPFRDVSFFLVPSVSMASDPRP